MSPSQLGAALARCRRGIRYQATPKLAAHCRQAWSVALAVQRGDHEEADRLRWLYWPERMRAEALARSAGLLAPPPKE